MRRTAIAFVAAFCALALCTTAGAQLIENPSYKHWAKFKPGSVHSMKGVTVAMGNSMDTEVTTTLKEVTDEKVVLEIVSSVVMSGNKMDQPPQKQEVKKMVDKSDPNVVNPDDIAKATDEEIKVAGGTYKCKKIVTTKTQGASSMTMTAWMSEEVPGGLVKLEGNSTGDMKMELKMEMTSCEKK